jgi:acyl-CoA synthetase (AMP-forming)/AMP-acid ligase II
MLARALAPAPRTEFRAHSQVRPYSGTFGEVEHVARRLAAGLRDRGVGPGDVIAFHLPNWMEATARGHLFTTQARCAASLSCGLVAGGFRGFPACAEELSQPVR